MKDEETTGPRPKPSLRRVTALYSVAVAASRVAGLVREAIAARYFGVSAAMSAFIVASQVPNVIRAIVADAAMEGALIPVLSDLLQQKKRREAARLVSGLAFLVSVAMTFVVVGAMLAAPLVMPLAVPGFADQPEVQALTVDLAQIMMPTIGLLSLSALATGTLYAFERFTVPSLLPLVWNVATIGVLVGIVPLFDEDDRIYAYAIATLAGTLVQLALPLPWVRGTGLQFAWSVGWGNPHVRRVLVLLLPTTLSLGLINFNLLANSVVGTLVSDEAPAVIDKAFRLYVVPQGLFAVAFAATLFPSLARAAARSAGEEIAEITERGLRYLLLLLLPSTALLCVLAEPLVRIAFERGVFGPDATEAVSSALVWWALSLPLQGASMLLGRVFFAIQRPWTMAALAGANLGVNVGLALLLHDRYGVSGILAGTIAGSVVMAVGQFAVLRRAQPAFSPMRVLRGLPAPLVGSAATAAAAFGGLQITAGRADPGMALDGLALVAGGAGGIAIYVAVLAATGTLPPDLLRRRRLRP